MNPATSRRLVLLSLGTMFAVTTIRDVSGKGGASSSTYRRLWATGALTLLLSIVADFAPDVAGPFALLIAMTYVMGAEDSIAGWLHGAIGAPATPAAQGAGSAGAAAAAAAKKTTTPKKG